MKFMHNKYLSFPTHGIAKLIALLFAVIVSVLLSNNFALAEGEQYTLNRSGSGLLTITASGGVYSNNQLYNTTLTQGPDGSFTSSNTTTLGVGINSVAVKYSVRLVMGRNGGVASVTTSCVAGAYNPCTGYVPADSTSPVNMNGVTMDEVNQISRDNAVCPDGSSPVDGVCPETNTDETTTCAIDGVGWIVCPAMTFLGNISDFAFSFLANSFLITDSRLIESGSGTYNAWVVMRNIANIAFVIVFLIIIFSQLTSVGISNYGVKKMLPRLVVAAVLVNASFLVCQLAVDLSNILGSGLKEMLDSVQNYVTPPTVDLDSPTSGTDAGSFVKQGFGVAAIVTALVAGGLTLATTISIPVLLAVVLALLMIVLILMARTALIVILIVASPLAFVAYLLPNTEQWFKKWYKMFGSLLMVYPIIAVVFGGSSLAAQIVNNGATVADGNDDNMLLQLLAIGIAAVPLFVVPSLLKGSIKSAGALGAKLSGWSNKANGAIGGKVKESSKFGQMQQYRKQQAQLRRAKVLGGVDPRRGGRANPLNWGARANSIFNRSKLSGKMGDRAESAGAAIVAEEDEKEIKNMTSLFAQNGISVKEIETLAKGSDIKYRDSSGKEQIMSAGNSAVRRAAIRTAMKTSTIDEVENIVKESSGSSAEIRKEVARAVGENNIAAKAEHFAGDMQDRILRGQIRSDEDLNEAVARRFNSGKLSAEKLVNQDVTTLGRIKSVANGTATYNIGFTAAPSVASIGTVKAQARVANTDPQISRRITGQQAPLIHDIAI